MGREAPILKHIEVCPLLFDLVADALGVMIDKAIASGHITGILGHLISGRGVFTYTVC